MTEQEIKGTNNNSKEEQKTFFDKERNVRLLKFVIVSAIGLGINYLIVFLMQLIIDQITQAEILFRIWFLDVYDLYISQIVAIIIVMIYNYIINKLWTFSKIEQKATFRTSTQFIKFAIVGAFGTVINLGLVAIFYDLLEWNEYLAVTIGFVVSVISNFIFNDIWTFNPRFGKAKENKDSS